MACKNSLESETKEKTLKALEYKKQTLIQKKDVWELSLHRECIVL